MIDIGENESSKLKKKKTQSKICCLDYNCTTVLTAFT